MGPRAYDGRVSFEVADLQEAATRFATLTGPASSESMRAFSDLVEKGELHDRVEQVADALAAGRPGASVEMIAAVAAGIEARGGIDQMQVQPLLYGAALTARLHRPDLGEALGALDAFLEGDEEEGFLSQEDPETELFLQSLAGELAALAGLDVAATLHYAGVFIDNFPRFSLPLGDVDERATRWLAQLLDMGTTRVTLRRALLELAAAWEGTHPRAAGQVRRWSEAPLPSDPTQDLPWMQALLPLARTKV